MSESGRIWDLLQRAYEGNTWHGPGLRHLLEQITAEQAAARPIPKSHTIWEIALHVTTYVDVVRRRLEGEHIEELPSEKGWPAVADSSLAAWRRTLAQFEETHRSLRRAIATFPDARLLETVPGRDYPFYLLLYGNIEHDLYHAGQIVVLMQAQGLEPLG